MKLWIFVVKRNGKLYNLTCTEYKKNNVTNIVTVKTIKGNIHKIKRDEIISVVESG